MIYDKESRMSEPTLHHLGFVVASIADCAEGFTRSIRGAWDGRIIHDPIQTVHATFLQQPSPAEALIELVQPDGPQSRVAAFLNRGGGLHHLCYEVDTLDEQLEYSRSLGAVVTQKPAAAVAFDGRRVAWVYTRDKLLLEYLERAHP
jgi:methylmalonyl-CoA/ethylmalonyl-CoA epimerase